MAFRKGLVLTFGLVNVIVALNSATESEDSLTTVCVGGAGSAPSHAPSPIKQRRTCSHCGDIAWNDVKKAQKVGSDQYVVVEQEEVKAVADANVGVTKKMLTLTVHDSDEVAASTVPGTSVYYVEPDGAAQLGAYSLLLDAVERHPEMAFLTTYTPTSKQSMFQLRAFNGALVLQQVRWPEQVLAAPNTGAVTPDDGLKVQMDMILSSIVKPFEPSAYQDDYKRALAALLATKTAVTGDAPVKSKADKSVAATGVVDLSAQLAAMLGNVAPATPARKTRARKSA